MCRVFFWVFGRVCLLWLVHFLCKMLLTFALLHFVLQGQTCQLLQVSLDFLLKKKLIYFKWRWITLQYCGGFCHTSTWISHGCTCIPLSQTLLSPPSLSHPSGCPSAPALSALFHASNLDWSSILHMVIYMFQCYSLKSSHPRLLPQSPKVCSLRLCLFCCPACRIVITVSLKSMLLNHSSRVRLCATP